MKRRRPLKTNELVRTVDTMYSPCVTDAITGSIFYPLPNGEVSREREFDPEDSVRFYLAAYEESLEKIVKELKDKTVAFSVKKGISSGQFIQLVTSRKGELHDIFSQHVNYIAQEAKLFHFLFPHTYCFPQGLGDSEVENISSRLLDERSYMIERDQLVFRGTIDVPLGADHSLKVKAYLSRDRMRLDLKYMVFREYQGEQDKLDVVARLEGGEYRGVRHFHLEKYGTKKIVGAFFQFNEAAPHFEYNRFDSGSVDEYTIDEGLRTRGRFSLDDFQAHKKISAYWDERPELCGGQFFVDLLDRVREDRRFIGLQTFATNVQD